MRALWECSRPEENAAKRIVDIKFRRDLKVNQVQGMTEEYNYMDSGVSIQGYEKVRQREKYWIGEVYYFRKLKLKTWRLYQGDPFI